MTDDKPLSDSEPQPSTPVLRVVSPDATPEEIAAIVAVFSALAGGEETPQPPRSLWAAPSRRMRGMMSPGKGAWRASSLPG